LAPRFSGTPGQIKIFLPSRFPDSIEVYENGAIA
jgi:hypothetical protein